jgi:hypothetical protein
VFVREICSSLPTAEVHLVPTRAEQIAAAYEKQSRMARLQEAVVRQPREDQWTDGDWSDFLAGFRDEQSNLDDEDTWGYEDEEPSFADPLIWEVQQEGGRPGAALLRGRSPLLSTVGLAQTEDAEALIQWCRTDAVTKAPGERA